MNRAVELVQKGKWRQCAPTSIHFGPSDQRYEFTESFLSALWKIVFPPNSCFRSCGSPLSPLYHLLPGTLSPVSLFIKISLLGDGGGVGGGPSN